MSRSAQRQVLADRPGRPEPARLKAIVPLLPYQERAVTDPARFRWSNWSRQTGKSFAHALRRIIRGLQRKKNQFLLSAGERQSRELMMKVRQHLQAMKIANEYQEHNFFEGTSFKQLEITIPNGIRIVGLPANPETARGFTGDVLLDEFAMHRHDREIWGAMFPSVTRGGGEVDVCSTPQGKQNMFYRLSTNESFSRDTLTIHDAIAQGLQADAEELRAGIGDDELWQQEFLCEFLDEATAFLTYEMLAACEDQRLPRELDLEALSGQIVVGMDIGRRRDLTVIWAFEQVGKLLASRGLIELRSTPFQKQFEILCGLLDKACVQRCCIDASGLGMQLAEQAVERFGSYKAEACTFTSSFRLQIATELKDKVEGHNLRIPVDPMIRNDLHSVRKDVTAGESIRLTVERKPEGTGGSHADRFWAAALACHAAGTDVGPIEVMMSEPVTRHERLKHRVLR